MFSTRKKLLDCKQTHLVLRNDIPIDQNDRKPKIEMIDLVNQTRFPWKQLSAFFPSTSQWTSLYSSKMVQYARFFVPAWIWKVEQPYSLKLVYMYYASLY